MAKRNELRRLLGGLDPGNARGREDITFGDLIVLRSDRAFPAGAESFRVQRLFSY